MRLTDLAVLLGAPIHAGSVDPASIQIDHVAGLAQAGPGALSFLGSHAYQELLKSTRATAVIVREVQEGFAGPQLLHPEPHFAYAKAANLFYRLDHGTAGVHNGAFVDPSAQLGRDVVIHPGVTVQARAEIGDRVVLYPGTFIGQDVTVGADTILYPGVIVYHGCVIGQRCMVHAHSVIGADGFGFAVSSQEICKIPQIGIARLEDDVELGALCTVDRAANGETVIRKGCKFDDHVHIAHNVEIGEHTMFSAQTGVAGSTRVGRWVLMGGQSGIADHLTIADGVKIGAKSGVVSKLTEAGTYLGFPAVPQQEWRRSVVSIKKLRDYEKRLRELEQRLAQIEEGLQ